MKQAKGLAKQILKRLPMERKHAEDLRVAAQEAMAKFQNQHALVRELESVATRLGADIKKASEAKPIETKETLGEKRRPGRSGKLTAFMSNFVNSHPEGVSPVDVRRALNSAGLEFSATFPYRALDNLTKQGRVIAKDGKYYPTTNKNELSQKGQLVSVSQ
jgi:hypothetical protein